MSASAPPPPAAALTNPSVVAKIDKAAIAKRGFKPGRKIAPGKQNPMELLPETTNGNFFNRQQRWTNSYQFIEIGRAHV